MRWKRTTDWLRRTIEYTLYSIFPLRWHRSVVLRQNDFVNENENTTTWTCGGVLWMIECVSSGSLLQIVATKDYANHFDRIKRTIVTSESSSASQRRVELAERKWSFVREIDSVLPELLIMMNSKARKQLRLCRSLEENHLFRNKRNNIRKTVWPLLILKSKTTSLLSSTPNSCIQSHVCGFRGCCC